MIKTHPNIFKLGKVKDSKVYDMFRDFEEIKKEIEEAHPTANFMWGQCMLFHLELKRRFPDAKCLFSSNHVVTEIDGSVWDWSGCLWFSPKSEPYMYDRYLNRIEEFLDEECNTDPSRRNKL